MLVNCLGWGWDCGPHLSLPLTHSNSSLCFGDEDVWPGVGSGCPRSQHKARWSWCVSLKQVPGSVVAPLPSGLVRLPQQSGLGTGQEEGNRPLIQGTREWSGVSPLPFTLRAVTLPPSPTDKPPVPPNQVSLLLHACSAELDQLPLMVCPPGPLPGSGGGGGEAKKRTVRGRAPHSLTSDLFMASRIKSKPLT